MDRTGNLHGHKYQRALGMTAWDALCFAQEAEWSWLRSRGGENGYVQGDNGLRCHPLMVSWVWPGGQGGKSVLPCFLLEREAGMTEQKAMRKMWE